MKKILLLVTLVMVTLQLNAQTWTYVGSPNFSRPASGGAGSLAIDRNGTPYIAFATDSNVSTVMKYNGSYWQVVGTTGFSAGHAGSLSITFDSSNNPYVAFQDAANGYRATVMKFDGGSWTTVGAPGFSWGEVGGGNNWIRIDQSGTPYVGFTSAASTSQPVGFVMKYDGSSWVNATAPDTNAFFYGFVINNADVPYVVTQHGTAIDDAVMLIKYNGGGWDTIYIDTGMQVESSIAMSTSDAPYVAFTDYEHAQKVTVITYNGTDCSPVGSPGFSDSASFGTSIAVDKYGTPYIAYQDAFNTGHITAMKYDGTNWITVGNAQFSLDAAFLQSIAIDTGGTPYVLFSILTNDSNNFKLSVMKLSAYNIVKNPFHTTPSNLKIIPNPNNGSFNVQVISNDDEPISLTITDAIGQSLISFAGYTNKTLEIKLQQPSGVYFITATTDEQKYYGKVVIE